MIKNNLDLYGNIFNLRDKIVGDFGHKKRLNDISGYQIKKNTSKEIEKKNETNNLHKNFSMFNIISIQEKTIKSLNTSRVFENRLASNKKTQSLLNNMTASKRIVFSLRNEEIYYENTKFNKKLNTIISPLCCGKLDEIFKKNQEFKNISKKVRPFKDVQRSKMNNIKTHLPPLFLNGMDNDYKRLLNL